MQKQDARLKQMQQKIYFYRRRCYRQKPGLIWRRCAEDMAYRGGTCAGTASKFTWKEALQHAVAQAGSSGKAWRVPEKDELVSINNKSFSEPSINPTAFPATPTGMFWSASPVVGSSDDRAWGVSFNSGYVGGSARNDSYYVRLVRAGQ